MNSKPRGRIPKDFEDLILKYGFDAVCKDEEDSYLVICPDKPTEAQQMTLNLLAISAGWKVQYAIGPRSGTKETLMGIMSAFVCGGRGAIMMTEKAMHRVLIYTTNDLEIDDGAWGVMCEVLSRDPYYHSWQWKDKVYDRTAIQDLDEHTRHGESFDVSDVKVLVNSVMDSGEFLRSIGGSDEIRCGGK